MKFLLDTHVWIWAVNDDKRLPKEYRRIIEKNKSQEDFALLDISIWEAGRIYRAGELTKGDIRIWFSSAVKNIKILSITPQIALLEQSLSWSHKDPADRLIASASIALALPLMTVDKRFKELGGLNVV